MKESTIQAQVRQAVNLTKRARLVRNHTGYDSDHKCRYGLGIGGADLVGLLRSGRGFALEIKTNTGKPTAEQLAWLRAFRSFGGFATIVRSVDEAMAALDRAERGESE